MPLSQHELGQFLRAHLAAALRNLDSASVRLVEIRRADAAVDQEQRVERSRKLIVELIEELGQGETR